MKMEIKLTMNEVYEIVAAHLKDYAGITSIDATMGEVSYDGMYDEREANGIKFTVKY
jgi:hypothetical protein